MASTVGPVFDTAKRKALNADLDIRSMAGGKPSKITVHNLSNNYKAEWNEALNAGEAIVTSDVGARSLVTSNGFSLLDGDSSNPPGFRLGALANINDTTTEDLLFETFA